MAERLENAAGERLCFLCLQGLGNLLLAEPAIAAAKAEVGAATVTVVVRQRGYAALLSNHPAVDEVVCLAPTTLLALRRRRFQRVYTCFPANDWRFELITWLVGGDERVGHRYLLRKRLHLPGAYTREVWVEGVDDVQQNLNLVGAHLVARPPHLAVEPVAAPRPLLALHPGSSTAHRMALKRWPPGHFRNLIERALAATPDLTVWLFAGPGEVELAEAIGGGLGPRVAVVAGLPLVEVARRLAACTCMVANDSGLMHLAAAVGVPTIGLFGPTDPLRTAPRPGLALQAVGVACAPCWPLHGVGRRPLCPHAERLCMVQLTPERVWAAVAPRLATSRSAPAPVLQTTRGSSPPPPKERR